MGKRESLTVEQSEEVAEMTLRVMPLLGMVCSMISDEEAELAFRGMDELESDIRQKEAGSVAYMAMGVDLEHNLTFRNARRNAKAFRAYLELRKLIQDNQNEEAADEARMQERQSFRDRLGL